MNYVTIANGIVRCTVAAPGASPLPAEVYPILAELTTAVVSAESRIAALLDGRDE